MNRSLNADLLKAIAIFAVVYIHGNSLIPYTHSLVTDWVLPVFRLCVPIFIILWAYFAEKSIIKRGNQQKYLTTRFYRLLIPFLFWSTVYFIITANISELTFVKALTKHWFGRGWSGQYYFIILFQLILLFPLIRYVSHYIMKKFLIAIAVFILFYIVIAYSPLFTIGVLSKIGDVLFVYWLPYVIIGIIYANQKSLSQPLLPAYIAIITLFLVPIEYFFLNPMTKPYLIPTIFISTILILNLALNKSLNFIKANSGSATIIKLLATNTLGIFCLNPLIIIVLSAILQPQNYQALFFGSSIIMPLLSTTIIISLCLLSIFLLKRLRLGILVAN